MNHVTKPARGRAAMLSVAVALVASVALLALAPLASAASDPLASGTTTITLNKGLYKKLKRNDVRVLKVSPAKVKKRKVTLPVSGGSLDPTTGQGTTEHSGGIRFKRGKRSVTLKSFVLDTTNSDLFAKIGGKRWKIAKVKGTTFARNGFGTNLSASNLKLTGKAAKKLNKKLGLSGGQRPFRGGGSLGAASSETQPKTVTVVAQNRATLVPDAGTFKKFATKGVNPLTNITPIAPAEKVAAGGGFAFTFPISGGSLAPDLSTGTVNASGGIEIKKPGGSTVSFTNLSIDFATKVVLADSVVNGTAAGRSSIATLDLTGATVVVDSSARTVTITNAVVRLQELSAALLNKEFPGGEEFVTGDSLGTLSVTIQLQ